jgi:hypothetical protein
MNLNEHGAACRCLLRLRENEGRPGMTDAAFIAHFLPRYPEWQKRPGAADLIILLEIAREFGLAEHISIFRDYEQLLREHRAGRSILVYTERVPEQLESGLAAERYVALVVNMDADAFTLWCPYPSGQSDNLPKAARVWWDRWLAIGIVLRPAQPAQ